jgi:hypothetical protein
MTRATWTSNPAEALELLREFFRDGELNDRNRVQMASFILWPDGLPSDVQDALCIYDGEDDE